MLPWVVILENCSGHWDRTELTWQWLEHFPTIADEPALQIWLLVLPHGYCHPRFLVPLSQHPIHLVDLIPIVTISRHFGSRMEKEVTIHISSRTHGPEIVNIGSTSDLLPFMLWLKFNFHWLAAPAMLIKINTQGCVWWPFPWAPCSLSDSPLSYPLYSSSF